MKYETKSLLVKSRPVEPELPVIDFWKYVVGAVMIAAVFAGQVCIFGFIANFLADLIANRTDLDSLDGGLVVFVLVLLFFLAKLSLSLLPSVGRIFYIVSNFKNFINGGYHYLEISEEALEDATKAADLALNFFAQERNRKFSVRQQQMLVFQYTIKLPMWYKTKSSFSRFSNVEPVSRYNRAGSKT